MAADPVADGPRSGRRAAVGRSPGDAAAPSILSRMASWAGAARSLAFPTACQICEAEVDAGPFCEDCRGELLGARGRACPRCALQVGPFATTVGGCSDCRSRRLGFDAAMALGPYQGPIRDLCLMLKREPNAWLVPWLCDLLVESAGADVRREAPDRVAAVPLHWRRRWRRGYDQAEALARALGARLGIEATRALRRVAATAPLADLGRADRAGRMRGAFRVGEGADVAGRSILLVDDILTTGATCGEAARTLKRAGARRVVVLVVGRAEG